MLPGLACRYCNVPLTRLLYPVPDLTKNVLGVHYTVTVDGQVKIGPTAMPGFWRENYVRVWRAAYCMKPSVDVH